MHRSNPSLKTRFKWKSTINRHRYRIKAVMRTFEPPGLPCRKTFNLVNIGPDHGMGSASFSPDEVEADVKYFPSLLLLPYKVRSYLIVGR